MRRVLQVIFGALWLFQASVTVAQGQPRPNVVLIYIDDLGYGDVGCYGCEDIPTPHIDRLAAEGVRFTASYITNPPCCPSRCCLMMGQYAQRFGKYGMSRGLPIPEDRPTLARFLSDAGYATGQIGKWDIGTKRQGPLQVGFSEVAKVPPKKVYSRKDAASLPKKKGKPSRTSKYFCLNEAGETVWLTDYNGDSMVNFVERHKDEPFFLYWSPEAVHSPSTEVPDRLMNRTTAKGKRRKLAGAIVSVDDQVGKLLATLQKYGLRENTLVIFTSDNGANGGEGGTSTPYTGGKGQGTQKEGWVRIPTVFSMPGTLPQGKQYDGLVANFDFYSTIAALAGKPIPKRPILPRDIPTSSNDWPRNTQSGQARWPRWPRYRIFRQELRSFQRGTAGRTPKITRRPDEVETRVGKPPGTSGAIAAAVTIRRLTSHCELFTVHSQRDRCRS